jgi:hypothetical protein
VNNDVRDDMDTGTVAKREQLVGQFIERSLDEVEQMRRAVPQLVKGDAATWQEVRFCAQRVASTAKGFDLGVLCACAQELARLTDEKFAGAKLDEHFLMSVTSGIETVALELNELALRRARGR